MHVCMCNFLSLLITQTINIVNIQNKATLISPKNNNYMHIVVVTKLNSVSLRVVQHAQPQF